MEHPNYDPDGREADDGRNAAIAAGCVVGGEGETFSCIPVDKGEEIDVERDRDPASILADLKCAAAISLAAIDAGVAVSKQRQLEGKAEAKRQEVRSHQRKAVDALWAARGFQTRGALLGLEAALTMYATDKVLGN